ncbi:hypothetical protein XM38_017630 [Halomicronema hongdechloris C2206]|uniref:Flippase-like domain-containing protein n=1 Tax=Halomicronema hongdechloris C2206 TaxID=1641165 RepID=A0A1Z3HKM8_9CYAN|nr:lysylphosphatidylglycerol synthase domain-containing protein [Halomicronema hongdechloris]ASC70816.1 hypothetical protein XM38_017630 [Halomicronema hongdechloris C2206]
MIRFLKNAQILLNSKYLKLIKWTGLSILVFVLINFFMRSEVFNKLIKVSSLNLIIFGVLLLVSKVFYAARWSQLYSAVVEVGYSPVIFLFRTNLLADFVEIAMLSSLSSEATRLMKLYEYSRKPYLCSASIVGDRVYGLISMIMLALALSPVLVTKIDQNISIPWGILILLLCVFLLIIYIAWMGYRKKLFNFVSSIAERMSFKSIANALMLSIVGHLCFASSYYFLFREVNTVSLLSIWSIVFTAQLSNVIPLSFLGIALGEASIIALSGLLGVTQASAIAVVAIVVASKYVFALSGFLIELFVDGREFIRVMQKARSPQPESVPVNDLSR